MEVDLVKIYKKGFYEITVTSPKLKKSWTRTRIVSGKLNSVEHRQDLREKAQAFADKTAQITGVEKRYMSIKKLAKAHLVDIDSPRQAFYVIWIEETEGRDQVVKESGVGGKVLDWRCWPCDNLKAAQKLIDIKVHNKKNPHRKYRLLEC